MSYDVIANGWRKLLKNGGVGYTEKGKSVNLTLYPSIDAGGVVENKRLINLVSGQKYTVKVDSDIYDWEKILPTTECICAGLSVDGTQTLYIGNGSILDETFPNTGEWFIIIESVDEEAQWSTVAIYDLANNGGMTLPVVVSEAETVHTIDPKYLPSGMGGGSGGSIPVIDLTHLDFYENDGVVELSYVEATGIMEIVAENNFAPIVVAIEYGGKLNIMCDVMAGVVENVSTIGLTGHIKFDTSIADVVISISGVSGTASIKMSDAGASKIINTSNYYNGFLAQMMFAMVMKGTNNSVEVTDEMAFEAVYEFIKECDTDVPVKIVTEVTGMKVAFDVTAKGYSNGEICNISCGGVMHQNDIVFDFKVYFYAYSATKKAYIAVLCDALPMSDIPTLV